MNAMLDDQEIRGAVERMAAEVATPALPRQAILAAGSRRRTRRRTGAVGGLALAATLAVSVSWSAASGGFSLNSGSGAPTTTNAFTEQLGHTLEQVLPGAKVAASMFADANPATRHSRNDVFPVRITYRGHVSDAFLTITVSTTRPEYKAAELCHDTLPWRATRPDCVAKDLADGGIVHAQLVEGPGSWTSRVASLGGGSDPLTIVEGEVTHGGTWALLQVHGGSHSNSSALTPEMVSTALQDPRFTTFLGDFTAHPERDPYGPLASISKTVVASGPMGTHKWTLSFAVISGDLPGSGTQVSNNCDYWEYAVDGKPNGDGNEYTCQQDGSTIHNPPPTDKAEPHFPDPLYANGFPGKPQDVVGWALSSTVLPGTAKVEIRFDDQPAELTAQVFTVHGDVPYFALVKPGSAKPDWKTATAWCLDKDGKELGKLYFAAPTPSPSPMQ
jgi:hypothetical protein